MPSADDISRTVEPGSLPQGDRAAFRSQLQATLDAKSTPAPAGRQPAPVEGVPNEFDYLVNNSVSDKPITSGLAQGPGAGPAAAQEPPLVEKLRALAVHARSPILRKMARDALRAEILRGR